MDWCCRYGPIVNTQRLLVQHGGFLYDSDYYVDELPFWRTVDGQLHRIIPYSLTNKDGKMVGVDGHRGRLVRLHPKCVRCVVRERRDPSEDDVGRPVNRVIGHPARAMGLKRLGLRDGQTGCLDYPAYRHREPLDRDTPP